MTRTEAMFAMMEGKKLRHRLFSDGEWIASSKKGDMIYTEDGYCIFASAFWLDRSADYFYDGWEVFD